MVELLGVATTAVICSPEETVTCPLRVAAPVTPSELLKVAAGATASPVPSMAAPAVLRVRPSVAGPAALTELAKVAAPAADRACTLVLPPPEGTEMPPAETVRPPLEM